MTALGIISMHQTEGLRELLAEGHRDAVDIVRQSKLNFGDALTTLKTIDPEGWERWYDDDNNIPAHINWTDRRQIKDLCNRMYERAADVFIQANLSR